MTRKHLLAWFLSTDEHQNSKPEDLLSGQRMVQLLLSAQKCDLPGFKYLTLIALNLIEAQGEMSWKRYMDTGGTVTNIIGIQAGQYLQIFKRHKSELELWKGFG